MGATSCIVHAGAPGPVLPTKDSRIDEVPCKVHAGGRDQLTPALVLTRTERFLPGLCVSGGQVTDQFSREYRALDLVESAASFIASVLVIGS